MKTGVATNIDSFLDGFRAANESRLKASRDAVKIEGFRLMRLLQGDLRKGAPGGTALAPLSEISQFWRRHNPLSALVHAIRYGVSPGSIYSVSIGAVESKVSNPG